MARTRAALALFAVCGAAASFAFAAERTLPLAATAELEAPGVTVEASEHEGRKCLKLTPAPGNRGEPIAIVKGTDFKDGTLEVELAGRPAAGAFEGARGFVGLAFRAEGPRFECFYLRPTNGRADDQLRRNHSTQYVSEPEFPWDRLRRESPGVYESYVDLVPGAWTRLKIVVAGARAQLFVNEAAQPVLIVNDLKRGADARGAVALWIGIGTEAWFRNLKIAQ
jgi:hypothetical protein